MAVSNAPGPSRAPVLYLSYDGMLEPLGQSQVAAYLEKLAADGEVHLISFEKSRDLDAGDLVGAMTKRLWAAGIHWHPKRYHKRPPILSTLWDMAVATAAAIRIAKRGRIGIFHGRSILSAAMLWPARQMAGGRLLVDIRGFWADERVDGGMIRAGGPVHRVLKTIERAMLRQADAIVTLTHASVPILRGDPNFGRPSAPIHVITTCTDLDHFRPAGRTSEPLVVGYVGQVGTWYLLDEMIQFYRAVLRRRPDARLLFVNQHQQDMIRDAVARADVPDDRVEIVAAGRDEVPNHIARMSIAMALITPFFSKTASAPTKLGEYLGCGVPVLGNVGCGDMASIISQNRVGSVLTDMTPMAIDQAADAMLTILSDPDTPHRCRETAERLFSLDRGTAAYAAIYRDLSA